MRGLIVVTLCACNQIYDVEETSLPRDDLDEDLDGIPNFDDNCPSLPNSKQADADNDEVGDICDAHPADANDHIIGRYFFNDPVKDPDEWIVTGWTFYDGYVEQAAVGLGNIAELVAPTTLDFNFVRVEASFVLLEQSSRPFENGTGILLEGPTGHRCLVRFEFTNTNLFAVPSGGELQSTYLPLTIPPGVPFRLTATVDRATGTLACSTGNADLVSSAAAPPGPIGLYTAQNAAQLQYVLVYVASDP